MKVSLFLILLSLGAAVPGAYAQTDSSAAQSESLASEQGSRYQQALDLGFYHEAYQRCSQAGDTVSLADVTRQSLVDAPSVGISNRLTDLLYQEMAGHALGIALQQDKDSQRCAVAGEIYRQLQSSGAPEAMKSFFGVDISALGRDKTS